MLCELRVKNFAIVEDGTLDLSTGLTVFTGETGAGKSLLLDAITLLLGAKAQSDLVRSGATCAEVEGVFDLSRDLEKQAFAESLGFAVDRDEGSFLLVRREISSKEVSKNRIWIQGRAATRAQLQSLLGTWVEVSGQHEFLRLGNDAYILSRVDHFGGLKSDLKELTGVYQQFKKADEDLTLALGAEQNRESRLDYLKFQLDEFNKLGLSETIVSDEANWIAAKSRLGNVEKIRKSLGASQALLESNSESAASPRVILQNIHKELRSLASVGPEFEELLLLADRSIESVADLSSRLDRMLSTIDVDPEALETAESKLSQMNRLKRKFNTDTEGLLKIQKDSKEEFDLLSKSEERLTQLREQRDLQLKLYQKLDLKLFERRQKAAEVMQVAWKKDIRVLGMAKAELELRTERVEQPSPMGMTRIMAYFSANAGESLKPLSKVASGGELSRIMLALKNLVAERSEIGVYLFDEVDSGIGGETAQLVGSRLRTLAEQNQVLCVTHLAQIAAQAHCHFKIHKKTDKGRTKTLIESMNQKDRELELSRMLGDSGSKAALSLARELLSKVSSPTKKLGTTKKSSRLEAEV